MGQQDGEIERITSARPQFRTLRMEGREWRHHERVSEAFLRNRRRGKLVALGVRMGAEEEQDQVWRMWIEAPDRQRVEFRGGDEVVTAVFQGQTWWSWSLSEGGRTNGGRPNSRLGITPTQAAPNTSPGLQLADGTSLPPLNRESRRLLDKFLSPSFSTTTPGGFATTSAFRWMHFDRTIFELASGSQGRGWDPQAFVALFPNLASKVKSYEARVATPKRIGYLTQAGQVTGPFNLHYQARHGDHSDVCPSAAAIACPVIPARVASVLCCPRRACVGGRRPRPHGPQAERPLF